MEKRFWIGLCLLVFLLAVSVWVAAGMRALHQPGALLLAQAQELALRGDLPQATVLAQRANLRWQNGWYLTAAAADHGPMDEIDSLFAELSVAIQTGDADQIAACCGRLSVLLRAMYCAHSLTLWNLL